MRYSKHTGSKAKTRKSPSRSSRKPFGFGYGITGVSLVTILTMTYFDSVEKPEEHTATDVTEIVEEINVEIFNAARTGEQFDKTSYEVSEVQSVVAKEDTIEVTFDDGNKFEVEKQEDAPKIDLSKMTKAQLIEHSEKVGVTVRKSWNKTKIIETLSV